MRWILVLFLLSSPLVAKTEAPPNPLDLQVHWWSYFDVKGEVLDERVKRVVVYLDALKEQLPPEVREDAEPLIDRITVNLSLLPELRSKQVDPPIVTPLLKEAYTTQGLVALTERSQQLEQEVESKRGVIDDYKLRISGRERLLNRLMTRYQREEEGSGRLLLGLRAFAERSYLAILQEKLRFEKEQLAALEMELRVAVKEVKTASSRLVSDPSEEASFEQLVESTRVKHREALEVLLAAEARAVVDDGESGQETALLAAINEASLRTELIFHRASRDLHMVLADNLSRGQLEAIRRDLTDWQASVAELEEVSRALGSTSVTQSQSEEVTAQIKELKLKLGRTYILLKELSRQVEQELSVGNTWWQTLIETASQWWEKATSFLLITLITIGDFPVTLLSLVKFALVILIGYLASRLIEALLGRITYKKRAVPHGTLYILKRLTRYVVMTVSVLIALSVLGLDFGKLALIAGALSVGIGFGLKGLASNIASGLTILLGGKLRVGDTVETLSGYHGVIKEINLQNTVLHTFQGKDLILPNAQILQVEMINWTWRDPFLRLHVPFSVAYGTDKELVKRAALEAADRVEMTVKDNKHVPSPSIRLTAFGESALEFELVVWVNQRLAGRHSGLISDFLWEIESSLKEHKIVVPFPQRDIHIRDQVPAK